MTDLRTSALEALEIWRKTGSGPRASRAELNQVSALVESIASTTRLIIETGNVVSLIGLSGGAAAAPAVLGTLLRVLGRDSAFLAALASVGECRADTPYAPVHLVIKADKTREWCCNHKSGPHCVS